MPAIVSPCGDVSLIKVKEAAKLSEFVRAHMDYVRNVK